MAGVIRGFDRQAGLVGAERDAGGVELQSCLGGAGAGQSATRRVGTKPQLGQGGEQQLGAGGADAQTGAGDQVMQQLGRLRRTQAEIGRRAPGSLHGGDRAIGVEQAAEHEGVAGGVAHAQGEGGIGIGIECDGAGIGRSIAAAGGHGATGHQQAGTEQARPTGQAGGSEAEVSAADQAGAGGQADAAGGGLQGAAHLGRAGDAEIPRGREVEIGCPGAGSGSGSGDDRQAAVQH